MTADERRYRMRWVDVFTERQLLGNPLAVVLEADGLSDAEMQAIARETNLSETTFVLPPEKGEHAAPKSRTKRWPHFAGSARRRASPASGRDR